MTRTTIAGLLATACLGGCPTMTPDASQRSSPIAPGTYIGELDRDVNGRGLTQRQSVQITENGGLTYFGTRLFEGAVIEYRNALGNIDEIETVETVTRTGDSILVNSERQEETAARMAAVMIGACTGRSIERSATLHGCT